MIKFRLKSIAKIKEKNERISHKITKNWCLFFFARESSQKYCQQKEGMSKFRYETTKVLLHQRQRN